MIYHCSTLTPRHLVCVQGVLLCIVQVKHIKHALQSPGWKMQLFSESCILPRLDPQNNTNNDFKNDFKATNNKHNVPPHPLFDCMVCFQPNFPNIVQILFTVNLFTCKKKLLIFSFSGFNKLTFIFLETLVCDHPAWIRAMHWALRSSVRCFLPNPLKKNTIRKQSKISD